MLFQQESSCAICAVAQGIEIWSISLSRMTLIILPIVQVPMIKGTLWLNSDSLGTTRNMTSSLCLVISLNCKCRIMNLSGLVHFLLNPTRFNGWSTRSTSDRTGNPHCCMKASMSVFTWLPLSTKALASLPSIVKSTSVSGLIQCAADTSMTNSRSRLCAIT